MHSFIKFLRKIPQKFYPKVFFFPQADVPTKAVPSTPFLLFLCLFPQFIHILNGYFGKFDSLLFSKFLYLAKTVYKFFSRRVQAFFRINLQKARNIDCRKQYIAQFLKTLLRVFILNRALQFIQFAFQISHCPVQIRIIKACFCLFYVQDGAARLAVRESGVKPGMTDNIDRLSFDNSYMYVYFNRDYDDGETFRFSYSWIQEYMYTLGADGSVEYVYTPGWFSEARVGQMTLTWHDPAGVDGVDSLGNTGGDHAAVLTDLDHGQQLDFTVRYDSWPAQLAQEGSRDNLPQDNDPEYDPGYDPDYQDGGLGLVGLVILLVTMG